MNESLLFIKDNFLIVTIVIVLTACAIKYVVSRRNNTKNLKNTNSKPTEKTSPELFIPSVTFKGEKFGYVFKTKDGNTGYYYDR